MSENINFKNNPLGYPIYGVPYIVSVPIFDVAGNLVESATGLSATISKNGDLFSSCTNTITEVDGGFYYLVLTASEMTANIVSVILDSTSADAKPTPVNLYTKKLEVVFSGVVSVSDYASCDSTHIKLQSGASVIDDFYNGCLCYTANATTYNVRQISDYNGTTLVAEVDQSFGVVPSSNDIYYIYYTDNALNVKSNRAADALLSKTTITANGDVPFSSMFNRIFAMNGNQLVYIAPNYTVYDNDKTTSLFSFEINESGRFPI